jgi:hypothetical protein
MHVKNAGPSSSFAARFASTRPLEIALGISPIPFGRTHPARLLAAGPQYASVERRSTHPLASAASPAHSR